MKKNKSSLDRLERTHQLAGVGNSLWLVEGVVVLNIIHLTSKAYTPFRVLLSFLICFGSSGRPLGSRVSKLKKVPLSSRLQDVIILFIF